MADTTLPNYDVSYCGIGGTSTIEVDEIDGSRVDLDFAAIYDGQVLQRVGDIIQGLDVPPGSITKAARSIIRTTSSFVTNSGVDRTVSVSANRILSVNQDVYISTAGYFQVVGITLNLDGDVTAMTIRSKLYAENTGNGTTIATDQDVVVVGNNRPMFVNDSGGNSVQINRLNFNDGTRNWTLSQGATGLIDIVSRRSYRYKVEAFNTLPGPIGTVSFAVDLDPGIAGGQSLGFFNAVKALVIVLNNGNGNVDYFQLDFLVSWNGVSITIVGNKSNLKPISFSNNYAYSLSAVGTSFIINFGAVADLQVRAAYEVSRIE